MSATNPGTWTEPAQAPVLPSMKQVAALRATTIAPPCRWSRALILLVAHPHSVTVSPWRWTTFHSPSSRRYT